MIDEVYEERNRVVAALTGAFPSGTREDKNQPGWRIVYVDLPTGQVSWHYGEKDAHLFAHLPPYLKDYDGHTTEEKYRRVAAFAVSRWFLEKTP